MAYAFLLGRGDNLFKMPLIGSVIFSSNNLVHKLSIFASHSLLSTGSRVIIFVARAIHKISKVNCLIWHLGILYVKSFYGLFECLWKLSWSFGLGPLCFIWDVSLISSSDIYIDVYVLSFVTFVSIHASLIQVISIAAVNIFIKSLQTNRESNRWVYNWERRWLNIFSRSWWWSKKKCFYSGMLDFTLH